MTGTSNRTSRETYRLSRWVWRAALCIAVLALYLALGLSSHRFEPQPPWLENGVVVTREDGLLFISPGSACTAQPAEWLPEAIRTSSIEVSLQARSYQEAQFGPARLFTISLDAGHRNLTIGQHGASLIVRLRTIATDVNGRPAYEIPGLFTDNDMHTIDVKVAGKEFTLAVDGAVVRRDRLPADALGNWDPDYPLLLGNEAGGQRPWLGEIRRATVRVGDMTREYAEPGALIVPAYYHLRGHPPVQVQAARRGDGLPISDNLREAVYDAVKNLAGFIPLAFVLAVLWRRNTITGVIVACAILSLLIELSQLALPGRYPRIADFVLNVVGGALGAVLARWFLAGRVSAGREGG